MKKRKKKGELLTLEVWFHMIIHFVAVLTLFWLVAVPPLWISLVAMVLEVAQMKILGHCFLTKFAHSRGVMVGKTYWQYMSSLMGFKDYKKAGHMFDMIVIVGILGILLIRILMFFPYLFT